MKYRIVLSQKNKTALLELICFILVLVFVYTGTSKLYDHHNFNAQIGLFIPLPLLAGILSYTIPVAELVIAVLITLKAGRLAGMYCFLYLLIIFTGYIIFLLLSSDALPCSCGGVVAALTWKQHLVFNGILILLSIAGIHLHKKRIHPQPGLPES